MEQSDPFTSFVTVHTDQPEISWIPAANIFEYAHLTVAGFSESNFKDGVWSLPPDPQGKCCDRRRENGPKIAN